MILLRMCIKIGYQNTWDYLSFIYDIFFVGVIMLSIVNSSSSIETKWYFVPFSIDTKESIFKRKNQFEQQIFHCSKKFEIVKSCESSSIILLFCVLTVWMMSNWFPCLTSHQKWILRSCWKYSIHFCLFVTLIPISIGAK